MKTIYAPQSSAPAEDPSNIVLMIQSVVGDTNPLIIVGVLGAVFVGLCWMVFARQLKRANEQVGFEIE